MELTREEIVSVERTLHDYYLPIRRATSKREIRQFKYNMVNNVFIGSIIGIAANRMFYQKTLHPFRICFGVVAGASIYWIENYPKKQLDQELRELNSQKINLEFYSNSLERISLMAFGNECCDKEMKKSWERELQAAIQFKQELEKHHGCLV